MLARPPHPWALLLGLLLSPALTQAQPTARDISNQDLQRLWDLDGQAMVREALEDEVRGLAGQAHQTGKLTITVEGTPRLVLEAAGAPGFTQLDDQGAAVRVPLQGAWRVQVDADLRVQGKIAFFRVDKRLRLTGELRDLSAQLRIELDASDPDRPTIRQVHPPQLDFQVRARTDRWYLNVVLRLFRSKLQGMARDAVDAALTKLNADLIALSGQPTPYGQGGPATQRVQPRLPLEQAALGIHAGIVRDHLPYGSLVDAHFDRVYTGTWEDSLTDPAFTPGNVTGYHGYGDSAIWTGHYLAANAFRYAVTQDPQALAEASATVDAIGDLLRVRGTPGLLNRALQPLAAAPGIVNPGDPDKFVTRYRGVDYVGYDGISRDQYMGVLFGLAAAYDQLPDPALRDRVRAHVEVALDYMLANDWTARTRSGGHNTTWVMGHGQQLAWLQLGNRVAPGKYAAVLDAYAGLADVLWFGPWVSTTDPHSGYYKYNLSHGTLYTLLQLETDPGRWWKASRALRVVRNLVGHHQNAHFDMIYAAHDPGLVPVVQDEVADLLALWLRRPRRYQSWDLEHDPSVDKVDFASATASTRERIARYPLPVDRRETTDFVWQRSPFGLRSHGHGTEQAPGVDFVLPYWMARFYRVLP